MSHQYADPSKPLAWEPVAISGDCARCGNPGAVLVHAAIHHENTGEIRVYEIINCTHCEAKYLDRNPDQVSPAYINRIPS